MIFSRESFLKKGSIFIQNFRLGIYCLTLLLFLVGCGGSDDTIATGSVTLSWTAPTLNEDGSVLDDLDGFVVFFDTVAGRHRYFQNVGNITTCAIKDLKAINWYFSVAAYDVVGNLGPKTEEIRYHLQEDQ